MKLVIASELPANYSKAERYDLKQAAEMGTGERGKNLDLLLVALPLLFHAVIKGLHPAVIYINLNPITSRRPGVGGVGWRDGKGKV